MIFNGSSTQDSNWLKITRFKEMESMNGIIFYFPHYILDNMIWSVVKKALLSIDLLPSLPKPLRTNKQLLSNPVHHARSWLEIGLNQFSTHQNQIKQAWSVISFTTAPSTNFSQTNQMT